MMPTISTSRGPLGATCRLVAAGIAIAAGLADVAYAQARPAVGGTTAPSPCGYVGDTLVPRMALGVRRVDGDDVDVLELHRGPGDSVIIRDAPLFRPFFVVKSITDSSGDAWHLLQDGYTAAEPLGWARGRHVHLLETRYAYTFANRKREPLADFHDDSKESYERLLGQVGGDLEAAAETVVVKERPGAEAWDPLKITDTVPFVELRIPREKRDKEHPDTTPTFRFGIPVENRLVHLGAVCGGPVDRERLKKLKETIGEEQGLEMLFVVDDTVSMSPFNQVVARFIRAAGELAVGRTVPVSIAVCSYTDGKPGTFVKLGAFRGVKGPADVKELAAEVEELGNVLPPGSYANPPERMLEGLRDALAKTKFQRGATLFVAVVGDTGHEPTDPGRNKLVTDVAALVKQTNARVWFMHVGRRTTPDEKLFKEDFQAVEAGAAALGVAKGRLVYQAAEENDLQGALEKARNEVEAERRRLQRQITRMESRTPYTEPGPKLLAALEARGIDRAKFDEQALQYFVPSRGWLFHPTSKETSTAQPQLRELFLLAAPEREAVKRLFDGLRDRLSRGEQIDGDAAIATFGKDLAAASRHAAVEARVKAAWEKLPKQQRSVGVFLEDVFGLRLKAALPFPPTDYGKERPAAKQEIARMLGRIGKLGEAFKGGADAFWFEASSLVP